MRLLLIFDILYILPHHTIALDIFPEHDIALDMLYKISHHTIALDILCT